MAFFPYDISFSKNTWIRPSSAAVDMKTLILLITIVLQVSFCK